MNLILGIALIFCGGSNLALLAAAVIGGASHRASTGGVFMMILYGLVAIAGGIALISGAGS